MNRSETAESQAGSDSGEIFEIFSGIQGEGLYVGERQIFVRFVGCNLECPYCDTPHARTHADMLRAERTAGLRDFYPVRNPISVSDLAGYVADLESGAQLHHSVVLTAGEPLAQPEFAAKTAESLKKIGYKVLLETNGTLPDALSAVIPFVDIVSMDMKLVGTAGGSALFDEHERFLRVSASKSVYVKIVVDSRVASFDLIRAAEMIADVDSEIPLVLQPVTSRLGIVPPSPAQVLGWQAECRLRLRSVRVIPQCHKMIGQL